MELLEALELVGHEVLDVEARAEEVEHLDPGLEDAAADDGVERQALEDEVVGVVADRHGLVPRAGRAARAIAPAPGGGEAQVDRGLGAGELEDDVGAAAGAPRAGSRRGPWCGSSSSTVTWREPARLGPAARVRGGEGVDLGDRDAGGARDARDLGAHRADRTVARGPPRTCRRGRRPASCGRRCRARRGTRPTFGGIDVPVERHDVEGRHDHVLREAAVAVHAEDPRVLADVAAARCGRGGSAPQVTCISAETYWPSSRCGPLAARPEGDDLAAELVAVDARRLDHPGHRRRPTGRCACPSRRRRSRAPDQDLGLARDAGRARS